MNGYSPPAPRKNRLWEWLISSFNEIIVVFWSCASFYLMVATDGKNQFLLIVPLIVGAVALVWFNSKRPVVAKVDTLLTIGVFLFVLSILGSYLFNSQRYDLVFVIGNLFSVAILFVALYVISTKTNLDLRKTLVMQSVVIGVLLPVVIASADVVWGRVTPTGDVTPNYVSMMALVCFIGAASMRSILMAIPFSVVAFYTIIVTQSRDSLLAAGIAAVILIGFRIASLDRKILRPLTALTLLGGPLVIIALYFVGIDLISGIFGVIGGLFLLNDVNRGLGSGGSGRTDLWNAAINLWMHNPIFGVGFKGHQQMMPDHMLAHNAYLGVLADVGLVGIVGYMLLVCVPLYNVFKRGQRGLSEYPQRLAVLISYLIYGLLESRAFSFGNTYSLLFLLVAFDSSTYSFKKKSTLGDPEQNKTTVLNRPASPGLLSQPKS